MKNKIEITGEKLRKWFDYQRFEKNEKLEKLIAETESRCARALSDDDLAMVSAAGEPEQEMRPGGGALPEILPVSPSDH